ncbi:hypothetical protein [Treponema denticola]|uniref:hypothetical protein n=1 Tax=Treponema denticola TaxID=158 RepID=UPI0003A0DDEF|nr:hypothetical protein [Treponema denticola]
MLALVYPPPPFSLLTIISLTNNFLHYCFSHKNNSIYKIISQEGRVKMKQKRSVSMFVALVLIIGAVVVMSGCSGVNNKLAGIAYAGTYGGEGENHSGVRYWEFTVSASGNFTGWFEILSSAKSECSGSIKADGSFTGSGKTKLTETPFTITGKIASDNTVTGKVMVKGPNTVSFSGNKK